jgi:hypothetical protein
MFGGGKIRRDGESGEGVNSRHSRERGNPEKRNTRKVLLHTSTQLDSRVRGNDDAA